MISLSRQEIVQTTRHLVVKVGTNVLTTADGHLNRERIQHLVAEICAIRERGVSVVLVSSGAVGAGMGRLGLTKRPKSHPELQAVAAIGQGTLIQFYEQEFEAKGVLASQVLLTADDLSRRDRYLNACNTFNALFRFGAIPIVNENDAVSTAELSSTFGDNDRLASLVANLFPESLLILLTDVDGLFDGDPALPESKLVSVVDRWTPDLMRMVAEKRSGRSKGGMSSKLRAAQAVTSSGGATIVANGDDGEILSKIYSGQEVGTVFFPKGRLRARKRWVRFAPIPAGTLVVDAGAANALEKQGKSLLPIGVLNCFGPFKKGDVVSIVDASNREIARGLTNYNFREVSLIRGRQTTEIATLLGNRPYDEIVHRDNIQINAE